MRILLVEENKHLAEVLTKALGDRDYAVDLARDGQAGWELSQTFSYDLVILNAILPKLDGISLCKQLRQAGDRTPILILTALDSVSHKVMGFDAGADDYVVQPFVMEELLARIRALLRRGSLTLPPVLEWDGLCCNTATYEATYEGQLLDLTAKEYRLLELFLRNGRRVLSRRTILDRVWPADESPQEDTVKAHIKRLRQKFRTVGAPADLIETVYGLGYRLNDPSHSSLPSTK